MYYKNMIKSFLSGIIIGLAGSMFIAAKGQGFKVIPALLFPAALYLICTYSFNLFTGKVGYVFDKEKRMRTVDLLIVLVFNALGALVMGCVFRAIYVGNNQMVEAVEDIALSKFSSLTFKDVMLTLLKSSLCGVFVYTGVYFYGKANNEMAKIFGVWVPIFIFAYLGLDHSIANMFYMSASLSFSYVSLVLIITAIFGNSIGAICFHEIIRLINK